MIRVQFTAFRGLPAVLLGATLMAVLAGCGSSTAATAPLKSTPTHSASATKSTSSYGSATASTSPSATTATVKLGKANVKGKSETVLQDAQGYTLYYFTKDSPTKSQCNGVCASLWPAATTSSTHISATGVSGHLTVVKDSHGNQIAYNGHLLYRYSKDTAPGQANGQGFLHLWWVATPSLTATTQAKAATSTTSSGGYSSGKSTGTSTTPSSKTSGSGWSG